MTQRHVRIRSYARRFGFVLSNDSGKPIFPDSTVNKFWDKLQKSLALDCKEAQAAMISHIDEHGPKIWDTGSPRGHLLKAGACEDYPEDLYWPACRERVLKICIEMSEIELEKVPEGGSPVRFRKKAPAKRGVSRNESDRAEKKRGLTLTRSVRSLTPAFIASEKTKFHLAHVKFWLFSLIDDDDQEGEVTHLHGEVVLEKHKTISGLFHAVHTAMIADATRVDKVVESLRIQFPTQTGMGEEVISAGSKESALQGLRRKLDTVYEKYYSTVAGDVIICFVGVTFKASAPRAISEEL